LANGDSIGVSHGRHFGDSTNLTISHCFTPRREKRKKGGRNERKICAVPTQQKNGARMKRKKKKRKQEGCDVAKVIDTVEQAVSTAKKVYRVIEPVVSAFTRTRKTK
jgi:hypothetical protein